MKQKWTHALTALFLALAVLLTVPILSAQTAKAIDLSRKCSLTIKPGSDELKKLDQANLTIDLYKVADALPDSTYDTYSYDVADGVNLSKDIETYEGLAELDNEDWRELAQDAAKSVLKENAGIKPEKDSKDLSCGLYLVVAHGNLENYVSENKDHKLVTVAYADEYKYSFLPQLISLPSTVKEIGEDGFTTAGGNWEYNVTVTTLKPSQELRFGDLEIIKDVVTFENTTDATFVFDVVARMDGQDEPVFSNVYAVTFSEAGRRKIEIKGKIPVTAKVTVKEVYSGASYEVTTDDTQTTVIKAPGRDTASVTFENKYDKHRKHGYGIVNKFSARTDPTGDITWDLDNEHDSATE